MNFEPLDQICPEVGRAELHAIDVPSSFRGVAPGSYVLHEFYCTAAACDCRCVLVQMHWLESERLETAASISFGWEKAGYYKKWSRNADGWRTLAGASLDPFGEQGPLAREFLVIFKAAVSRNHHLVAAFRRHYRLVRDTLRPPSLLDL